MKLRTVLFWTHLVAGVSAGVVILIMSVTGVLLTYEKQMVAWAERLPAAAVPAPDAPRVTVEALLARAREARPNAAPTALTVRVDPRDPVTVAFGRDGQMLLNPYTGEVVAGATRLRAFFHGVTDWHRWLGAHGDLRPAGRAITGASNLVFLVLVLTGAYLWLPRAWTWAQVRAVAWFRGGLGGKARDFNWHNVVGLWSFAPLAIIVASGAVISYPWASNLVYRVMGEAPPAPPARQALSAERGPGRERPTVEIDLAGLDSHLARAATQVDGWRSIALRVPTSATAPLVFTIDAGTGGQPQKRGTLTLDRATGNVVSWEPFESATPGRRARMILRFAHTGEVLGLAGQTIAGLVSAGGALLVYTGLALSLRRFVAWRKRRGAAARLAA
jgi:uncharacterized iron-regulated membrane protein